MNNKLLALIAGLTLSAALTMGSAQAAENPFGVSNVDKVQHVAMSSIKCGDGKEAKEGKCGGSKDSKEGKCGDGKTKKDGKCGAGKCGAAK